MLINEIYQSIEGEVSGHHQGAVTTFIRTQGCNLRCDYCDSKYTWDEHKIMDMTIVDILSIVEVLGNKNVTITGGEPMMQESFPSLVRELRIRNYNIAVETNGTYFPNPELWANVNSWVVDWKWEIEKEEEIREASIYFCLKRDDFIKFIIKDKEDFKKAVEVKTGILKQNIIINPARFAFSPCHGVLEPKELVRWILELEPKERKDIILNLQIHKYIWPVERRGV